MLIGVLWLTHVTQVCLLTKGSGREDHCGLSVGTAVLFSSVFGELLMGCKKNLPLLEQPSEGARLFVSVLELINVFEKRNNHGSLPPHIRYNVLLPPPSCWRFRDNYHNVRFPTLTLLIGKAYVHTSLPPPLTKNGPFSYSAKIRDWKQMCTRGRSICPLSVPTVNVCGRLHFEHELGRLQTLTRPTQTPSVYMLLKMIICHWK